MRCWIMEHVVGKVKKYEREYSRKLKSGRSKTYKTEQYVITISKDDNIFEDGEQVVILSEKFKNSLINFDKDKTTFEADIIQLRSTNQKLFTTIDDQKSIIEDQGNQITNLTNENQILTVKTKELESLKNDERLERFDKLQDDHDRLRNKHDHLQERLRVALEEINDQQKVISDLSNRGFMDYIFGRLPESYKQLQSPKS